MKTLMAIVPDFREALEEGLEDADRAGRRRTADIGIVGLLDIVTTLLLGGNILDLLIRVNIFIGNIGNIVAPIFGNIIVGGVGLGGGGYFERTDIEISAAETGTGTGGAGATTEEEAGAALRGGRQYRPLTTPSTTTIAGGEFGILESIPLFDLVVDIDFDFGLVG